MIGVARVYFRTGGIRFISKTPFTVYNAGGIAAFIGKLYGGGFYSWSLWRIGKGSIGMGYDRYHADVAEGSAATTIGSSCQGYVDIVHLPGNSK